MKMVDLIFLLSAVISGILICCCSSQSITEGPTLVSLFPSSLYYSKTEQSKMNDVKCSASCRPDFCTFTWERSGREVTNSSTLSLGALVRDAAGNYTCTARNPRSFKTSNSETIVLEVIHGPILNSMTLTPSNLSYTIMEGHVLNQITCSAECVPNCTYTWNKLSTIEIVSSTAVLSLGSVKRGDAASYECIASNPKSFITANSLKVGLGIIYGPDSATLSTSSLYYNPTEGNIMSDIRCSASCSPTSCTYSWRKSGVEMSNTSVLSLRYVSREMSGHYVCTAKNPVSKMSSCSETITVEVVYGPAVINLMPSNRTYTLNEGEKLINISCHAECYPKCTYQWKKSYKIVSNTDVLALGSVRRGDAGIYDCYAKNPTSYHYVNSLSVELSIIYGTDSVQLSPSSLVYVHNEGETMNEIECKASCYPYICAFTWEKDGSYIGNTSMLVLRSLQREKAGNYQCTARNPASKASRTGHTVYCRNKRFADLVISNS